MESSEGLCSFPTHLLHLILSLLPLKALFRFRCVCRLWRSLPFSLLFLDIPPGLDASDAFHHWFFTFRLLARKVNERRTVTYKSTMYTYGVEYDREMLGSSGYTLQAESCAGFWEAAEEKYAILNTGSSLFCHFSTGVLDIADSANGLLLLTLRVRASYDFADFSLKLFVYNPISKDLRGLPTTQWAPQKLSMIARQSGDEGPGSAYKIYSLGRHYRPGTTNLLYSFEVFDSEKFADGWQPLSHVKANLTGSGDLYPGSETARMGYVNSKASCNDQAGFLYWMTGRGSRAELEACNMNSGFFYRLPGLTYETSFISMWSHASGLQLACGVAAEGDLSITCAVEIWALHQGKEEPEADGDFYGAKSVPEGTEWRCINKMPQSLWDQLTGGRSGKYRIRCAVSSPLVFVIAEGEEETMVIYNTDHKVWQLGPCLAILHQLFNDEDALYYKVSPWIVSFRPKLRSLA